MSDVLAAEPMDPVSGTPRAKGFSLDSVQGGKISLDDYKGRFVLLNFWATWCAPCRKEMPAMSNLHDQLSNRGLEVVGVHVGPSLAGVKKFLQSVPVTFTIIIDKDMSLATWGVRGLPTTYLVNPEGKLVYKAIGEREWDSPEMVNFLNSLLVNYERMASEEAPQLDQIQSEEHKSFFANFIEFMGWGNDYQDTANQILPN